jgi:hypothetical protein
LDLQTYTSYNISDKTYKLESDNLATKCQSQIFHTYNCTQDKEKCKNFLNPMLEIEHNNFKSAEHTVASFLITVKIRQKP